MISTADMTVESQMSDLLELAKEHKMGNAPMSELENNLLIEIIKEKAWQELDFGQEIKEGPVKLVKRVTGNVSIFFGKK